MTPSFPSQKLQENFFDLHKTRGKSALLFLAESGDDFAQFHFRGFSRFQVNVTTSCRQRKRRAPPIIRRLVFFEKSFLDQGVRQHRSRGLTDAQVFRNVAYEVMADENVAKHPKLRNRNFVRSERTPFRAKLGHRGRKYIEHLPGKLTLPHPRFFLNGSNSSRTSEARVWLKSI